MRIAINADDFGLDEDTARATIECFERGGLTSATLMPKMPATDIAADFASKNRQFSFGVHLTYVCDTVESPISAPADVPDLVGPDGRFLPSQTVRKKALRGKISIDQIARETTAQIESLRARGVEISHVDSHGHLHKFAPFRKALAKVLPGLGISRVRGVQDLYLKKPFKSPTYWLGPWWHGRLRRAFRTPDHFYMCTSAADTDWPTRLLDRLPTAGTLEVGVHPGHAERWRQDEFDASIQFAQLAKARGHELIPWAQI